MGKCFGAFVFFLFKKYRLAEEEQRSRRKENFVYMWRIVCTCVYSRHTVFLHTYYELVIIDVRRRGKIVGEGDHHSEFFFFWEIMMRGSPVYPPVVEHGCCT